MFNIPDFNEQSRKINESLERAGKAISESKNEQDKIQTKRFNINLWVPIMVTAFFSILAILQQYNNKSTEIILKQQLQELQQISLKSDSLYMLLYQMQQQKDTTSKK